MNNNKKVTRREPMAFKRVTVAMARRHYLKNPNIPMKMITAQDFDTYGYNKDAKPDYAVIFDGDLIETPFVKDKNAASCCNLNPKKDIIHKNWLKNPKNTGPYKRGQTPKSFYYLSGKTTFFPSEDWKNPINTQVQICSKPLNVLSTDCLDAVDCWVKK